MQTPTGVTGTPVALSFAYELHEVPGRGRYFTLVDEVETYAAGGRPVQPRTSVDVSLPGALAKGVLWTGGAYMDLPNFDPLVSRVITDERYIDPEPGYGLGYWFPVAPGSVNRFLSIEGKSLDRLVLTPGQFKLNSTGTSGTQRLYTGLEFEVYHAPFENTDFTAPSIWNTWAWRGGDGLTVNFEALVTDEGSDIERVVVLYRPFNGRTWHLLDLAYDPVSQVAVGSTAVGAPFEYLVQAVDTSGNVAMALNHGGGFGGDLPAVWYLNLPIILKP